MLALNEGTCTICDLSMVLIGVTRIGCAGNSAYYRFCGTLDGIEARDNTIAQPALCCDAGQKEHCNKAGACHDH